MWPKGFLYEEDLPQHSFSSSNNARRRHHRFVMEIRKPRGRINRDSTGNLRCLCNIETPLESAEVGKIKYLPIIRNYPNLGLPIAGLQFHEKPIISRWRLTLFSSSTTRLAICGSGVS